MTGLLARSVAADPLVFLRDFDAEAGRGAPFPPGASVRLELFPDAPPALSWALQGARAGIGDPAHATFAHQAGGVRRVLALDAQTGELLDLRIAGGAVASTRRRIRELAGVAAEGLAYDAAGDRLFVLEGSRGRVLRVSGVGGGQRSLESVTLPPGLPPLRGLAYDPATGQLHALAPGSRELLELSPGGQLVAVRHLPDRVPDPRAIAIAASADPTDEPSRTSLFVVSAGPGGGTTSELALQPLALAAATTDVVPLVQTIDTAAFVPPSPDPSGVDLLAPNGPLLVSDAEVDEMAIYVGVNLYEVSLAGALVGTSDTTFFSREPTGVALNPAGPDGLRKLLFSQDNSPRGAFEVTPDRDGDPRVTPGDAPVRLLPSSGICVSGICINDPEGSAFGGGDLYFADGVGSEVWRVRPGPNGILDGGGDDQISHFDTAAFGLVDPEGIAYDGDGGNLYVVGEPTNRVAHVTSSGTLLRWLDTSAASARTPAGLAYGPGPAGDPARRLYVVARGVDNDSDPNENDGKLYVFSVNPLGGNLVPSVSAGPDHAITLSQVASLDGTVDDDEEPNPPGQLTTTWSKVSGPGTVTFANPGAVDTTASFSSAGSYVVRLTANDGQLEAQDEATVTVTDPNGASVLELRVASGSDDAEQGPTGTMDLTSSDLELVTDGSANQIVGVRFTGAAIPQGANVTAAWLQFQVDETSSVETSLAIQAEASDHAAPFLSTSGNLAGRVRTSELISWPNVAPWSVVGEAGPNQRTPDLSNVVQQIVSRPGWASGNAIVLIVTGTGKRVAESFSGSATGAALLHVEFVASTSTTTTTSTTTSSTSTTTTSTTTSTVPTSTSTTSTSSSTTTISTTTTTLATTTTTSTSTTSTSTSTTTTSTSTTSTSTSSTTTTSTSTTSTSTSSTTTTLGTTTTTLMLERRVASSFDDAEQGRSGSVNLTSLDLDLVKDGSSQQVVGMRFTNVTIPRGASIRAAWIQFQVSEKHSSTTSLLILGQAADNAAPFASTSGNVSSRPRTTSATSWTPAPWPVVGAAGPAQRTPDLSDVVQEVVDRGGWVSGNAIAFIVTGTGKRVAESFEGAPTRAPLLHVDFVASP